jgi:hypothetical protein
VTRQILNDTDASPVAAPSLSKGQKSVVLDWGAGPAAQPVRVPLPFAMDRIEAYISFYDAEETLQFAAENCTLRIYHHYLGPTSTPGTAGKVLTTGQVFDVMARVTPSIYLTLSRAYNNLWLGSGLITTEDMERAALTLDALPPQGNGNILVRQPAGGRGNMSWMILGTPP